MHGNSLWFLFDLEVNWTWMCLWQILWGFPVTSKNAWSCKSNYIYTSKQINETKTLWLIAVAFNENCKCLKPKLTCCTIIGVLGFSFEFKTLSLLPVHVHVRLCWVALSLCKEGNITHNLSWNTHGNTLQ